MTWNDGPNLLLALIRAAHEDDLRYALHSAVEAWFTDADDSVPPESISDFLDIVAECLVEPPEMVVVFQLPDADSSVPREAREVGVKPKDIDAAVARWRNEINGNKEDENGVEE